MYGGGLQWMVMFLLGWLWTNCFKALFTIIILKRMHPWNKKNLVCIMPTDTTGFIIVMICVGVPQMYGVFKEKCIASP